MTFYKELPLDSMYKIDISLSNPAMPTTAGDLFIIQHLIISLFILSVS